MRKLICFTAAACSFLGLVAPKAHAIILAPNATVSPNAQADPFSGTLVASTGVENFSVSLNGATLTGDAQEYVITNYSGNMFGSSNLTFVIQVDVTGGTTTSGNPAFVQRVGDSGFTGV